MNYQKEDRYLRAEERLKKVRGFYVHFLVYICTCFFVIVVQGIEDSKSLLDFDTYAIVVFWGFGIGIHALETFMSNWKMIKAWETQKLQQYIAQEEAHRKE
ncbi:MAG: 2TM domain-containing protein [Flavobacteriaceae bacterium]|nr:2TM domain-containing protein [Flavobacteriaceae bacterium]